MMNNSRLYQLAAGLVALTQAQNLSTWKDMCVREPTDHDLIYPWDGAWPKLQFGKNYSVSGKLIQEQFVQAESTQTDIDGNPLPGEISRAMRTSYFDLHVWSTNHQMSAYFYEDEERKRLLKRMVGVLDIPMLF